METDKKRAIDVWKITRRVAACFAILTVILTAALWPAGTKTDEGQIIAVPGIIQAYACEMVDDGDGNVTIKSDSGLDIGAMATQNIMLLPPMTTSEGLRVILKVDEEELQGCEISFDISCNYGAFFTWEIGLASSTSPQALRWECHGQSLKIQNGEWFYWRGNYSNIPTTGEALPEQDVLEAGDGIYTNVTVRADGNIVGYAVFEMINMDPQMAHFGIVMRESVFYPKVDGQFQEITEAYIQERLQAHTQKPMAGAEVVLGGVYHSARGPQESVDIIFASACHGIRYSCNVFDERYADREITFDFSAEGGRFRDANNKIIGKNFTVVNDTVLYWMQDTDAKETIRSEGAIYIDVIIRADGHVIGYAVIQIGYAYTFDPETGEIGDAIGYGAASCHSVCYPPVDGELPDLTEEEARAKIEEYKQAIKSAAQPRK